MSPQYRTAMKQYNRIMPGEHGKFLTECLEHGYIGASWIPDHDLSTQSHDEESIWRQSMTSLYLDTYPDKSIGTARTSVGFLRTICFGLSKGDIILASNGKGSYHVGEVAGDYYYAPGSPLPHQRAVKWKNTIISRSQMSEKLKNSIGSIGTCCNLTKYADELELLIGSTASTEHKHSTPTEKKHYKERSLHRLLAHYLLGQNRFSKTIFHEISNKSDQSRKWIHPDMVAVEFNQFQDPSTQAFLKAAETKRYVDLYSFELKRSIMNDHQLKEYFFQALSNSNWANYGYLVALEISEDVLEEMERLNRAFGIGLIELSPYSNDTKIRFQARKNELDYHTIDKLSRINHDFRDFIAKTTKVLNAHNDVLDDVKNGLQKFCDKGFLSEEEIVKYCNDNGIPC